MSQKTINYSSEEVYEFLINSKTKKEFCEKLGYKDYRAAKNICKRFNFDIEDLGKAVGGYFGLPIKNGDKFNYLTVIEANYYTDLKGEKFSLCLCQCGQKTIVKNDFLKRNHTKSCGCLNGKDKNNKIKNGMIFGKLTVIDANCQEKENKGHCLSKCKCECGNTIFAYNNRLRNGQISCGCVSSKGEFKISKILSENNICYKTQYKYTDLIGKNNKPLRFDFAIFDNLNEVQCLIEYQGKQHYQPTDIWGGKISFKESQQRDERKRNYCKKNKIKLIEIPYTDYDKLSFDYLKELIESE